MTSGPVVPVTNVETHVTPATEEALIRVRLTCQASEAVDHHDTRVLHALSPASADPLRSESASVVVGDGRACHGELRRNLLLESVGEYPGAAVVGLVESDRSALVWVRVQPPSVWEDTGYVVAVSSHEPGPAGLYPSVVYGWMRWWAAEPDDAPPGYPRSLLLPRPPERLDAVVYPTPSSAATTLRLHVDAAESVRYRPAGDPEDPTEMR